MADKAFGNDYDTSQSLAFFKRWYKLLIAVFLIAAIVSTGISFLVKPRYKSTAVIFPTNSNRISKAIMDYHYSLDFMDYGIERDCEYAIQILSSQSMRHAVCSRFNLAEHYGIPADDPHLLYKVDKYYRGYVTVKRTDYLGVEVSVLDVDPQWAADIANYIASYYDTLCHEIHLARAADASAVMQEVCDELRTSLYAVEDSANGNKHKMANNMLMEAKSNQLADIEVRAAQTKVDMQSSVSYKFWLDKATPADKKAYPKRAVIVLLGAFGSLIMCIFVLLLFNRRKPTE